MPAMNRIPSSPGPNLLLSFKYTSAIYNALQQYTIYPIHSSVTWASQLLFSLHGKSLASSLMIASNEVA